MTEESEEVIRWVMTSRDEWAPSWEKEFLISATELAWRRKVAMVRQVRAAGTMAKRRRKMRLKEDRGAASSAVGVTGARKKPMSFRRMTKVMTPAKTGMPVVTMGEVLLMN